MRVLGLRLSYVDQGSGPPVVFLHGNATHSYYWRNAIAYLSRRFRCIAPDLPGMGRSDPVRPSGPNSYGYDEMARYLEVFLQLLDLKAPAVFVGHEIGGLMAVDHVRHRPQRAQGLVLIEAVFRPSNPALWEPDLRSLLQELRGPRGEELVLNRNAIIERYLPRLVQRRLSPFEMAQYLDRYRAGGEVSRPLLALVRSLPLTEETGPLDDLAEEARRWCSESPIPKLVIGGNPGHLVPPPVLGTCARWTNTVTRSVPGLHFLLEDAPELVTDAIWDWLEQLS